MAIDDDEAEIAREAARMEVLSHTPWGWANRWLPWVLERACRVAVALVLWFIAMAVAETPEAIAKRPLASLSIADLAALVGYALLAFGIVYGAYKIAFGASLVAPPPSKDFHGQAEALVRGRRREAIRAEKEAAELRAKVERRYARSRLWGVLTDPDIKAMSPRYRGWLILALYALAAFFIWLGVRNSV